MLNFSRFSKNNSKIDFYRKYKEERHEKKFLKHFRSNGQQKIETKQYQGNSTGIFNYGSHHGHGF